MPIKFHYYVFKKILEKSVTKSHGWFSETILGEICDRIFKEFLKEYLAKHLYFEKQNRMGNCRRNIFRDSCKKSAGFFSKNFLQFFREFFLEFVQKFFLEFLKNFCWSNVRQFFQEFAKKFIHRLLFKIFQEFLQESSRRFRQDIF